MNTFRRIKVSISTGVNRLLDSVENHEAVADEAIRQAREAVAKATVRLERVRRDTAALRRRVEELRASETNWEQRALRERDGNRARAVECLERRNHARAEASRLDLALQEQERVETDLVAKLDAMRRRVEELTRRRNLLGVREQRARAGAAMEESADPDAALERWEEQVLAAEIATGSDLAGAADPLERHYRDSEVRSDLEAELDELGVDRAGEPKA